MSTCYIVVRLAPGMKEDRRHPDDVEDLDLDNIHVFEDVDDAEEALDTFHEVQPIKVLEDYEIRTYLDPEIWIASFVLLKNSEPLDYVGGVLYFVFAESEEDAYSQLHDEVHVDVLDRYDIEFDRRTEDEFVVRNAVGNPLWRINPYWFPVYDGEPWLDDSVQFPRLIAELEACGAFTHDVLLDLAVSMDLQPSQIAEIIDRAQATFDQLKEKLT